MRRYLVILYVCAMAMTGTIGAMANGAATVSVNGTTTGYETLLEALAAANASMDAVVTMTDDAYYDEGYELPVVTSRMTLDINGHELWSYADRTLTARGATAALTITDGKGTGVIVSECDGVSMTLAVEEGATVTMTGGLLRASFLYNEKIKENYAVHVSGGSTFRLTGGTVESRSNNNVYGIYAADNGSTIDILGGTLTATALNKVCYAIYCNGRLNVSGGDIRAVFPRQGECVYLSKNGRATITGGRFRCDNAQGATTDFSTSAPKANVSITGGLFAHEGTIGNYVKGMYVVPLSHSSKEYAEGYTTTLSTEPYTVDGAAMIINSDTFYATLEEAMAKAAAGDTVVLMKDYVLAGDLTVRKGVVLMLPYNILSTCVTKTPETIYPHATPFVYRTLMVQDGIRLTVEGELTVGAVLSSVTGGNLIGPGMTRGAYSLISLGKGSMIDIRGTMYCWGYVAGSGTVTVQSGATLYEPFVFTDWRGGNRSSEYFDSMFPFHQIYVQNVEVPVTFLYGSRSMTVTDMNFQSTRHLLSDIPFITPEKKGLFRMKTGSQLTRSYDGTTDRITYEMSGSMELGEISLEYEGMMISSSNNVLHLNNNMTLIQKSGTLTLPYSYALTAGAQLHVEKGAQLTIAKGKRLYLYDRKHWGQFSGKGYVLPLIYTVANGTANRSVRWATNTDYSSEAAYAKVTSAILDVQGSMSADKDAVLLSIDSDEAECAADVLHQEINLNFEIVDIPFDAERMPGDVDGDGALTRNDANMIVDAYLGLRKVRRSVADVNGDGKVTVADAIFSY